MQILLIYIFLAVKFPSVDPTISAYVHVSSFNVEVLQLLSLFFSSLIFFAFPNDPLLFNLSPFPPQLHGRNSRIKMQRDLQPGAQGRTTLYSLPPSCQEEADLEGNFLFYL